MSKAQSTSGLHMRWQMAKDELRKWKKIEADLRMEICEKLLNGKEFGSHRYDFDGYRLTATRVANYSLDQAITGESYMDGLFTAEEESLIKVSYDLKVDPYKKANFSTANIDKLITLKDGMPQLEVVYF